VETAVKLPLTQELEVRVLRQLTLGGPSTASQVAAALGSSESLVCTTIKRLAKSEVVSGERAVSDSGQPKIYRACPTAITTLVERNLAVLLAAA